MSRFEDLSGEILMAIFEYMNVEDVWTIFLNMNSRLRALVYDSRLRLTADVTRIGRLNFDEFCLSLISKKFSNLFTLILSNHYNRYPQIKSFLSQTNFSAFQSLHALTLLDVNHDELMEIAKQVKDLPNLIYVNINTHEIFRDQELSNITCALLHQLNVRVCLLTLHEKIQWRETETVPSSNSEVLSLDFINADRLLTLLPNCPRLHSLSVMLDARQSLPKEISENILSSVPFNSFNQITSLRLGFHPFNVSVLKRVFSSVPCVRRLSVETPISNIDHMRSTFWTVLLQEQLPLLERICLMVHGWFVSKTINNVNEDKLDEVSIIDSYRFDQYWIDRVRKHIFKCHIDCSTAVLEIR